LVWGNATLAEDESAEAVVSIIGSSTAAGYVSEAVVSILGSSTSSGDVRGAVVSILGSSRAVGGEVGGEVISVLGNTYINVPVRGEVIAVLGNVELGPNAVVNGNVVCVGGAIKRAPGAIVHGEMNHVGFARESFSGFEGLHAWIDQCLKYGRPLAFGPNLMWVWWIAIGFLVLYILVAALFPKPVESCLQTLEERPGYSLLTALLVTLIAPLATILLLFTVVGAAALAMFLFFAGLFGKIVMIAWIGRRITKWAGSGPFAHAAMAVLIGGIIVLGLYTVPVVGFLVAKLLSWLGLGVVVYTIILSLRRNRTAPPPAPAPGFAASPVAATAAVVPAAPAAVPPVEIKSSFVPPVVPPAPESFSPEPSGSASAGFTGASTPPPTSPPPAPAATAATAPTAVPTRPPPIIISAATLHRAGFWIRVAASVLDALLVGVAVALLPNWLQPNFLLVYAAYCVVLWALKGTTVGGIVCSLKVVRLNDQPVDWSTALVRALGGFLSLFAAGIGFIWVAFDDQRQSWHDKIAGTTIVHVPRGVSLV
jgi:uncharacterized RDD family membrane protein YckC